LAAAARQGQAQGQETERLAIILYLTPHLQVRLQGVLLLLAADLARVPTALALVALVVREAVKPAGIPALLPVAEHLDKAIPGVLDMLAAPQHVLLEAEAEPELLGFHHQ
jgi:hypothetical protein